MSHTWCEVLPKIDKATVEEGFERKANKRKDWTFYDDVYDAPRQTDKHSTSWRSDVPPPCLGGVSHEWVPVNTHGTLFET